MSKIKKSLFNEKQFKVLKEEDYLVDINYGQKTGLWFQI